MVVVGKVGDVVTKQGGQWMGKRSRKCCRSFCTMFHDRVDCVVTAVGRNVAAVGARSTRLAAGKEVRNVGDSLACDSTQGYGVSRGWSSRSIVEIVYSRSSRNDSRWVGSGR